MESVQEIKITIVADTETHDGQLTFEVTTDGVKRNNWDGMTALEVLTMSRAVQTLANKLSDDVAGLLFKEAEERLQWSKEDEDMYNRAILSYTAYQNRVLHGGGDIKQNDEYCEELSNQQLWLKELRQKLKKK